MIMPDGYGEQTYDLKGEKMVTYVPERGEITTYQGAGAFSSTGIVSNEGEFLNNNWHGKGIVTYDNGDWLEADWEFFYKRKEGTGGTCYRAETGTFHEILPYYRPHYIHDHGADVCQGDGIMGFGQHEDCYALDYQRTLAMMCKGDNFTFNDLLKLPFKVALGTVLVVGEIANSPAGQAALANQEAKNQRKREAAAYKKGQRDGIRKAARKKRNLCMVDSTYC